MEVDELERTQKELQRFQAVPCGQSPQRHEIPLAQATLRSTTLMIPQALSCVLAPILAFQPICFL